MGIDRSELSPALQQKIVYAGTNAVSFAKGSADLAEFMDLAVDPKQIERVTERIGAERCAQRDREVAQYLALPLTERKDKPAGVVPPALAVVSVDGGRLQVRSNFAPPRAKAGTNLAAGKDETSDPAGSKAEAEALPADDKHRGTHWREDKIGLLMTMTSEEKASDPCPQVPAAFVDPTRIVKLTRELKAKKSARVESGPLESAQETDTPEQVEQVLRDEGRQVEWQPPEVAAKQLTATRQPWAMFGPLLALAAWQLGFYQAARQAFVGDGADNVWTVWRNHFSSFVPVLDIIHAISYVFAAAMAGRPFAAGWQCYVRWVTWVWQGQVEQVIAELAQRQAELGPPQPEDGETHPRQVVSTACGYLQTHKDKMRYPDYRRRGLPITSSYVESAVKQFNQRVKGTEKFWTEPGAEALLQLRADYLGTTNVLADFWQDRQDSATGQPNYAHAA